MFTALSATQRVMIARCRNFLQEGCALLFLTPIDLTYRLRFHPMAKGSIAAKEL